MSLCLVLFLSQSRSLPCHCLQVLWDSTFHVKYNFPGTVSIFKIALEQCKCAPHVAHAPHNCVSSVSGQRLLRTSPCRIAAQLHAHASQFKAHVACVQKAETVDERVYNLSMTFDRECTCWWSASSQPLMPLLQNHAIQRFCCYVCAPRIDWVHVANKQCQFHGKEEERHLQRKFR